MVNVPSSALKSPAKDPAQSAFATDLESRVGTQIKSCEQAVTTLKTDALRRYGISVAQHGVLLALYCSPGQSSAQLARSASVTPQAMTPILTKLEQQELIRRAVSPLNNRILTVTLTALGEEMVMVADSAIRSVEQRLFDEFTEDEREQFKQLLERAANAVRRPGSAVS